MSTNEERGPSDRETPSASPSRGWLKWWLIADAIAIVVVMAWWMWPTAPK